MTTEKKMCKYCCKNEATKYSKYSNGEFCSKECARGYSTSLKRKEISKKVSKKLTGTGNPDVEKICPTCGKTFTLPWKRKHRVHCSPKCAHNSTKVKEKISRKLKNFYKKYPDEKERLLKSGKKGREQILRNKGF